MKGLKSLSIIFSIIVISIMSAGLNAYGQSVWTEMSSGTSEYIYDVCGKGGIAFAVGDNGKILKYDGSTWAEMTVPSGMSDCLQAVWGRSLDDIFAVGNNGTILHYDGNEWQQMSSNTNEHLTGLWGDEASSATDIFAVGRGGTILHYNGSTWTEMTSNVTNHLLDIWGFSENNIFAVGTFGTILHYNGTTWTAMEGNINQHISSVWGNSSTDVFAVGSNGKILHYNGSTWTEMISNTIDYLRGVYGNHGKDVFAVGEIGTILHYDGESWTKIESDTSNDLWSVCESNERELFAVGEVGTILHYDFGSWAEMQNSADSHLNSLWGSSKSNVFAVGDDSNILKYNGTNWTKLTISTTTDLKGVWGSSANNIFAVGSEGKIIQYDGSTWTEMSSNTSEYLKGVYGTSENNVIAVGYNGTILHYNGNGNWTTMASSTLNNLNAIWGSFGTFFAVGNNGTILCYKSGAWTAMTSNTSVNLNSVWGDSEKDIFAVGDGGVILHYNGETWTQMANVPTSNKLKGLWGIYENDVYAVGEAGTILHYDGSTWTTMIIRSTNAFNGIWGHDGIMFTVGDEANVFYRDYEKIYSHDIQLVLESKIAAKDDNILLKLSFRNQDNELIKIEGLDVTIKFDKAVIEATGMTLAGGILENKGYSYALNINTDEDYGEVSFAIFAVGNPISITDSDGIIADIQFKVKGNAGDTTNLNFTKAQLSESDVDSINGSVTINSFIISGNIKYFKDSDPINNAIVKILGTDNSYETTTNETGYYAAKAVAPEDDYTVTPSKIDDFEGLSATDASRIARYAARLYTFTCYELIAADVSRDKVIEELEGIIDVSVDSKDASRVARYAAGLITNLQEPDNTEDLGTHWTFIPESTSLTGCSGSGSSPIKLTIPEEAELMYSFLDSDKENGNFIAIRIGDVTGNKGKSLIRKMQRSITLSSESEIQADTGDSFTLPISLKDQDTGIEGIDIKIKFDKNVLNATNASLANGILNNQNYSIVKNIADDEVTLVIYANSNLVTNNGDAVFINFDVVGQDQSESNLSFTKFNCNSDSASGGFNVNGELSQNVKIKVGRSNIADVGTISGQVTTSVSVVGYSTHVAGATVTIFSDGNALSSVSSDNAGNYTFSNIPKDGTYSIEVESDYFDKVLIENITVSDNPISSIELEEPKFSCDCTQAELDAIIRKYDQGLDNKIGLEEAIHALKCVSEVE
ncbi:hypothetical protein GMMP15_130003 [Candidatus Magnetomoraceae bacterium gMMP-15]